jgi:hypothetical protein
MKSGQTVEYLDWFTGEQRRSTVAFVDKGRVYIRNAWDRDSYTQVTPRAT